MKFLRENRPVHRGRAHIPVKVGATPIPATISWPSAMPGQRRPSPDFLATAQTLKTFCAVQHSSWDRQLRVHGRRFFLLTRMYGVRRLDGGT